MPVCSFKEDAQLPYNWGLRADSQLVCNFEASRETLICVPMRPLDWCAPHDCQEASRQTPSLCLSRGLKADLHTIVLMRTQADAQLLWAYEASRQISAPLSCEASRQILSSCVPMRPLARCLVLVGQKTSRQTLTQLVGNYEVSRQLLSSCGAVSPLGRH